MIKRRFHVFCIIGPDSESLCTNKVRQRLPSIVIADACPVLSIKNDVDGIEVSVVDTGAKFGRASAVATRLIELGSPLVSTIDAGTGAIRSYRPEKVEAA